MFSTPRKRPAHTDISTPSTSPAVVSQKGLFKDHIWHCNCYPRQPAIYLRTQSNTNGNRGKWFYACQKPKAEGCKFFLWDSDARKRVADAVLNNSTSEVELRSGAENGDTPETPSAASKKMKAKLQRAKDDNDYDDQWGLSPEEESRLVQAVEEADEEPPRKSIKTSQLATPNTKEKSEHTFHPMLGSGEQFDFKISSSDVTNLFHTPSSRTKEQDIGGTAQMGLRSPSVTPIHFDERNFVDDNPPAAANSPVHHTTYDIGPQVMELLEGHKIDEDTLSDLEQLLNRHALKMAGIVRGRDITRVALKAKEATIVELQQKVTAMEAEREMDRTILRHIKSDMAKSVENRRRPRRLFF